MIPEELIAPMQTPVEAPSTIAVQGRATASADPDLVVLHFSVAARAPEYGAAAESLGHRVAELRRDLVQVDVDRSQVKTTSYGVSAYHEREDGKSVFRGYHASHDLRLELSHDVQKLNRVLKVIAGSVSEPNIRLSFEVTDPSAMQKRALAAAVEDARSRAEVIATAAGVSLGRVLRIEHGSLEVRVRPMSSQFALSAFSESESAPDIEPTSQKTEASVTVIWAIIGGGL